MDHINLWEMTLKIKNNDLTLITIIFSILPLPLSWKTTETIENRSYYGLNKTKSNAIIPVC
jgi:hypothetical protein